MTAPDASPVLGVPAEIQAVRLPRLPGVFERRARRFFDLASQHPAGDWLAAMGQLCRVQSHAAEMGVGRVPAAAAGLPLAPDAWHSEESWPGVIDVIVKGMRECALPSEAATGLRELAAMSTADRIACGRAVLGAAELLASGAVAPFIAAALQVSWGAGAMALSAERIAVPVGGCPVCGSPPVAALVQGDDKVRYLCCSLCASQWHLPRTQCGLCRSAARLSYLHIDALGDGVKAEACASCRAYLKVFYQEARPATEPVADDAATLALDLLMGERGDARAGLNLLVTPIPAPAPAREGEE